MLTSKRTRSSIKSNDANSSTEQTTKKQKRARSKSASDDNKEFLFLDEPEGCIFEDFDVCKASGTASVKKPSKQGKMEMKSRICGLTWFQRNRVLHYVIPAFNSAVLPTKSYKDLQRYPSLDVTAPSAIYVAAASCPAADICHQRPRVYDHYKNLLYSGRTRYLNQLKKNKRLAGLEETNVYSSQVFNFAERYNADPDPYFMGCYDYYYTGGNLCVLPDNHYLLHAEGEYLENLVVSTYKQQKHTETAATQTFDAQNSEIFEMREFPARTINECLFTVRQRTELTLNNFSCPNTQTLYSFKAKVPFISSTHIPNYTQHLLTSNMCQQLRLYDLDEGEARTVEQYNMNNAAVAQNHSWNMLRAYNEHAIVYANDQEIFLMDPRTTQEEWLRTTCRETHAAFGCERITCIAVSHTKPYLYVANTHHLHTLDLRKFESNIKEKSALCTWTHQMHYPAAFMDTLSYNGSEYIAFASAVAGEVRICEAGHKEMEFNATSLPYQPPTLKEAYQHAKLSGRCLQAAADLTKRVALCNTGLTFCAREEAQVQSEFEEESSLISQLLVSNSIGDVFAYNLLEKQHEESMRPRVNEQSAKNLQNYAVEICSKVNALLQYTDVCQMPGIQKAFRCRKLSEGCVLSDEFEKNTNPRRLGRWQKSFAALKQFKDALAQDLLSIWDVDEQADQKLNLALPEDEKHDMPIDCKVNNWLNMGTLAPPPMTTIYLPTVEVAQPEQRAESVLNAIILADNTQVSFEFVNKEQEMELFGCTQASALPLGQIIQTEQLEISTESNDAIKQLNLSQLFSRRNSREDITSIPASSEGISETVKNKRMVHIEIPASATSTTESKKSEWVPKRPSTPAKLKSTVAGNNFMEIDENAVMEFAVFEQETNVQALAVDVVESVQGTEQKNDSTTQNEGIVAIVSETQTKEKEASPTMSDKESVTARKIETKEKNQNNSLSDKQSESSQTKKLKNTKPNSITSDQSKTSTVTSLKKEQKNALSKKKQRINSCSDQSITSSITKKKEQKTLLQLDSKNSQIISSQKRDQENSSLITFKTKKKSENNSVMKPATTPSPAKTKQREFPTHKLLSPRDLKSSNRSEEIKLVNKFSPIKTTQKRDQENSLSKNSSKTKQSSNFISGKSFISQEKSQRDSLTNNYSMIKQITSSPAKSNKKEFLTPQNRHGVSTASEKSSISSGLKLLQKKQKNAQSSASDKSSINSGLKLLQKKKKNAQSSASDKSSINSGLKLLQKKKRNSQSSAEKIALKSPNKIAETIPNDRLKQTNLTQAFTSANNELNKSMENVNTTINRTQLNSTLNFTQFNSTLNSTLNATALNKSKKKKPKFKKYVKGF